MIIFSTDENVSSGIKCLLRCKIALVLYRFFFVRTLKRFKGRLVRYINIHTSICRSICTRIALFMSSSSKKALTSLVLHSVYFTPFIRSKSSRLPSPLLSQNFHTFVIQFSAESNYAKSPTQRWVKNMKQSR